MPPILVGLTAEVTTDDKTGAADMAGTSHLSASSLHPVVDTTLLFIYPTHHHIQHRYVYPFVLFILAIRQTAYLANGTLIRAGNHDSCSNIKSGTAAST